MKKYVIDNNVALVTMYLYIKNKNLEVGQVTVRHLVFSELIVQLKAADKKHPNLKDAEKVFEFCFGNKHTIREGKGTEYKQVVHTVKDNAGIPCVTISPRLANIVYKQAKTMEINRENVLAACEDLITCGRMYQELTIDAAKTMYDVNIPYAEGMMNCRLLSRENTKDDFDSYLDWKFSSLTDEEQKEQRRRELFRQNDIDTPKVTWKRNGGVRYVVNTSDSQTVNVRRGKKTVQVRQVKDFIQMIRIDLLSQAIDFGKELMRIKQELPDGIKAEIKQACKRKEIREGKEMVIIFHDIFKSIQSWQTVKMRELHRRFPEWSSIKEQREDEIKKDAHDVNLALANQIRLSLTRQLGLTNSEIMLVLLSHVIDIGNNSSFAHMLLEQEFFSFVLNIFKEDKTVPQWTEDYLIQNTFEDGDKALFVMGYAEDGDKTAKAKVPLNGEFTIRLVGDNWVASKPLSEVMTVPEVNEDRLVFVTKAGGGNDRYTCNNIGRVCSDIQEGVILVPYDKEQNLHDSLVSPDGVLIGKFRSSINLYGRPTNSKPITDMYRNKTGEVEYLLASKQDGQVGSVAIVVLKNVRNTTVPKIIHDRTKQVKSVTQNKVTFFSRMRSFLKNETTQIIRKPKPEMTIQFTAKDGSTVVERLDIEEEVPENASTTKEEFVLGPETEQQSKRTYMRSAFWKKAI